MILSHWKLFKRQTVQKYTYYWIKKSNEEDCIGTPLAVNKVSMWHCTLFLLKMTTPTIPIYFLICIMYNIILLKYLSITRLYAIAYLFLLISFLMIAM